MIIMLLSIIYSTSCFSFVAFVVIKMTEKRVKKKNKKTLKWKRKTTHRKYKHRNEIFFFFSFVKQKIFLCHKISLYLCGFLLLLLLFWFCFLLFKSLKFFVISYELPWNTFSQWNLHLSHTNKPNEDNSFYNAHDLEYWWFYFSVLLPTQWNKECNS